MRYEWFIGLRYLKAKRKQTFISIITVISIAGVTVGVMALIGVPLFAHWRPGDSPAAALQQDRRAEAVSPAELLLAASHGCE